MCTISATLPDASRDKQKGKRDGGLGPEPSKEALLCQLPAPTKPSLSLTIHTTYSSRCGCTTSSNVSKKLRSETSPAYLPATLPVLQRYTYKQTERILNT